MPVPLLEQVMHSEVGRDAFRASPAFAHRDREVVAARLANGAPCAGHAAMFEPWPGSQRGVRRWFLLDNGAAVGVADDDRAPRIHLWEPKG